MLLGETTRRDNIFSFTGLSPSMVHLSRAIQLKYYFVTLPPDRTPERLSPMTSYQQGIRALALIRFRLFPVRSPLLGKSLRFLFLRVLRCFNSSRSPAQFTLGDPDSTPGLVFLFGNPRIKTCLAVPRGLSQPTTSFIAS